MVRRGVRITPGIGESGSFKERLQGEGKGRGENGRISHEMRI
ncbi:MAG: hypothetical protein QXF80_07035 [Thermoplasmatales archaeon]